jgi:hypothetical protein
MSNVKFHATTIHAIPPVPRTQSMNSLKEAKVAFRGGMGCGRVGYGPDHLRLVPKVRTTGSDRAILPR